MYGQMISDNIRTDAYARALKRIVKRTSVVVDIGAGTGILSLLAAQLGARKIYAIEPSDVIYLGREIAAENGYENRIEFIQEMSTRVTLPEQVDIIVSDMNGVLPLFEQHLPSLIDAQRRLLAPGGTIIPWQATLWMALVEAPKLFRRHTIPWETNRYGLDMRAVLRCTTNTWRKGQVKLEQLLTEPKRWATLDYRGLDNPNVSGDIKSTIRKAGTGHGIIVWFDSELFDGVCFSNAPDAPELIYGSAFFPWPASVACDIGDTVSIALRANLVGDDYIWSWDTCVRNQGNPGHVKASFKQSTFLADPLSLTILHKRASDHKPILNDHGRIEQRILQLMNGQNSLEEIAKQVAGQFSGRFVTWYEAMNHVSDVSEKYSR